jgi:hypothetical protein
VVLLTFAPVCFAQSVGQDVDDLALTSLDATTTRLRWTAVESVECKQAVTYSVFRGTSEDFTPSSTNRIASGLTKATYLAKEPTAGKDYYYSVKAVITQVACVPHSGTMRVYPLDLGQHFTVEVGDETGICTAQATSEIQCASPLPDFHAVIAEQGTHEYLIGCRSVDYEGGDWTCVNLTSGTYQVGVHSRTITVWDSGMYKANMRTGKKVSPITPIFSLLARIR